MKKIPLLLPLLFCLACWAIVIAIAIACSGCAAPLPKITYRGNYADYSYSAKSGILIAPRAIQFNRIIIGDK